MASYLDGLSNYQGMVDNLWKEWEGGRMYNFLISSGSNCEIPTHPKFQREFDKGKQCNLIVRNLFDAFENFEDVKEGTNLNRGNFARRIGKRYIEFKKFIALLDDTLRRTIENTITSIEEGYEEYKKNEGLIPLLDRILDNNCINEPKRKSFGKFSNGCFMHDWARWRMDARNELYNLGLK